MNKKLPPLLLSRDDLEQVFSDPEFVEYCFACVQELLLDSLSPPDGPASRALELQGLQMTVRVEASRRGTRLLRTCIALNDGAQPGHTAEIWAEPGTGVLTAVADSSALDAWRLAMPSGLAARYLAPATTRSLGVLGAGEPVLAMVRALLLALPAISVVRVFGAGAGAGAERLRDCLVRLAPAGRGPVVMCDPDPSDVAVRSDVLVVAGPPPDPSWLTTGSLLISHGPLPDAVLPRCRRFRDLPDATGRATVAAIARGMAAPPVGRSETILYECCGIDGWEAELRDAVVRWSHRRGLGQPLLFPAGEATPADLESCAIEL
ncbi:hypothetical protein [Streptomyces sp. ST2-7A]|uniref:hypothetical protein n=1 Tax=Streptomyces sp. ST2-7A TaxID=2907214 RepID=UPI001F1CD350|nr:hypothetical protein [Streptomyces sp. ST2-7A]MCE7081090.1 hypothetical protein [Streptomyces sp. ST2-7A]